MPKVILISGGSDGLGKAVARKLTASGDSVIILAHNRAKLEAAAREVGCDYVEAELTDYRSLESAVSQVIDEYGKIDVLVNNAGVWIGGSLEENDPVKIAETISVNTTGTIFLTRAVLPQLKKQKNGQIINVISQDGLCAKKDRSVYHASKWAITGFTKCLREDLESYGIRVTALYPGLIKTSLFSKNLVDRDLSQALDPVEVAETINYVINLNQSVSIPEISISNSQSKMNDTNSPIDLNIDPNMITPSDTSPQSISPSPVSPAPTPAPTSEPLSSPFTAPVSTPSAPAQTPSSGVIDITPQASEAPSSPTPSTPPTPSTSSDLSASTPLSHLSDISPDKSEPEISPVSPAPTPAPTSEPLSSPFAAPTSTPPAPAPFTPPVAPFSAPAPSQDLSTPPESTVPASESVTPPAETPSGGASVPPVTPSSPLAEDPDLVQLVK